jgi:hypothetical protein
VTIRGKDLIGNQSAEVKQEFVLDWKKSNSFKSITLCWLQTLLIF